MHSYSGVFSSVSTNILSGWCRKTAPPTALQTEELIKTHQGTLWLHEPSAEVSVFGSYFSFCASFQCICRRWWKPPPQRWQAEISSSTCASKYIGPLRHQLNEPVIMWQSEVFLWSRSLTEPSPWKLKETHRSCRFINEAIFGGSPGGLSGKMDHVKRITLLLSSGWTSDVFLFEMNQHEEKEADDHRQWSTELSRFGEVNQALCECRWTCEYVEWVLMWCDVQILSFYSFTQVFRDPFTLCGSWIHEIRRSCVTNHLVSVFRPIRVWTCHWAHRRVQPAAEVHLQDTPFMSSSQTLNVFMLHLYVSALSLWTKALG